MAKRPASITFKQTPATADEKAIAQVLETFARMYVSAPGSLSDLYTASAEMTYFSGSYREQKTAKGRDEIHKVFSARSPEISFEGAQIRDVVIKVEGDKALASGHWTTGGTRSIAGGPGGRGSTRVFRFGIEDDRTWELHREADGWRIHRQESRNDKLTTQ